MCEKTEVYLLPPRGPPAHAPAYSPHVSRVYGFTALLYVGTALHGVRTP